jgi:hypothetical protein
MGGGRHFSNTGRCWEIHLRDADSEALAAEKRNLVSEESPLAANQKMMSDQAAILRFTGKAADAASEDQRAADEKTRVDAIQAKINDFSGKLADRAQSLHDQGEGAWIPPDRRWQSSRRRGPPPGHGPRAGHKPSPRYAHREKMLKKLGQQRSDIDLRPSRATKATAWPQRRLACRFRPSHLCTRPPGKCRGRWAVGH